MDSSTAISDSKLSRRRARRIVVVAAVSCLGLSRPAAASGPIDEFDHPNVTWYDRPAAEAAAPESLIIQNGTVDPDDGCTISGPDATVQESDGEINWRTIELAYDPDACRSLFVRTEEPVEEESATSQNSSAQAASSASDEQTDDDDSDAAESITVAGNNFVFPRRAFVGKSEWLDPAGIVMNAVRDSINYRPSNMCASYRHGSHHAHANWFWIDGWRQIYTEFNTAFQCDHVATGSKKRFENGSFCSFGLTVPPTRTRFWPNRVSGYPGGYEKHEPNGLSKTGGCSGLLQSETSQKRTFVADDDWHNKGFK